MIDLATSWIEIRTVPSVWADYVANQVEVACLIRYLLSNKVIVDRGNEFLAEFGEMIINDNGITKKPITSRNLQVQAILERVHQTIENTLCTFKVQNMVLDDENSWDGILISLHHVYRKANSTHFYAIHLCPINLWTQFNNISM